MTIPSPAQLLSRYELSPKHSFGQNFLCDPGLTAKIAAAAVHSPEEITVEIGAGLGALTDALLDRGGAVTVVERDRELVPVLRDLFADASERGRLTVVEGDAKQVDYAALFRAMDPSEQAPRVLAGNLPYQITGPLLELTVGLGRTLSRAVFLVQKEVADRLAAAPRTKEYGALTVFTQAQFEVQRAFVIKPGAFLPRPRVDSAVVVLRSRKEPITEETGSFRKVVKSAFAARRKTLRNAWKSLLPGAALQAAAERTEISLDARGETLTPEQFARFTREYEVLSEEFERSSESP